MLLVTLKRCWVLGVVTLGKLVSRSMAYDGCSTVGISHVLRCSVHGFLSTRPIRRGSRNRVDAFRDVESQCLSSGNDVKLHEICVPPTNEDWPLLDGSSIRLTISSRDRCTINVTLNEKSIRIALHSDLSSPYLLFCASTRPAPIQIAKMCVSLDQSAA